VGSTSCIFRTASNRPQDDTLGLLRIGSKLVVRYGAVSWKQETANGKLALVTYACSFPCMYNPDVQPQFRAIGGWDSLQGQHSTSRRGNTSNGSCIATSISLQNIATLLHEPSKSLIGNIAKTSSRVKCAAFLDHQYPGMNDMPMKRVHGLSGIKWQGTFDNRSEAEGAGTTYRG
jgi:hypothetical protein